MRAQVWVIRGGDDNRRTDAFVDGSYAAVAFPTVEDGIGLTTPVLAKRLEADGVPDATRAAGRFRSFVHDIRTGDVVLLPDPARAEVVVGRVVGDYEFHHELEPDDFRHRRRVDWIGRTRTGDLPPAGVEAVRGRTVLHLVVDPGPVVDHADAVAAGRLGKPATDKGPVVASASTPRAAASRAAPAPRKAVEARRTCPSCGLNWPLANFAGDELCADCR